VCEASLERGLDLGVWVDEERVARRVRLLPAASPVV
jgi:hypothetical protein